MTTLKEAAQKARDLLDAIWRCERLWCMEEAQEVAEALRAELAKPVQPQAQVEPLPDESSDDELQAAFKRCWNELSEKPAYEDFKDGFEWGWLARHAAPQPPAAEPAKKSCATCKHHNNTFGPCYGCMPNYNKWEPK
jgi:plasmid stabilization system protein ParE